EAVPECEASDIGNLQIQNFRPPNTRSIMLQDKISLRHVAARRHSHGERNHGSDLRDLTDTDANCRT
ncbi:hypothetical protein, partial [Aestuariivirga sp.]|uniref:hypothetical protein n=1 Tax=Aestuariivirga sp. TaxID=2650926 RepID=UPI003782E7D9